MSALTLEAPAAPPLLAVRDEHRKWPKTPRLTTPFVITEKIDGTNACVAISRIDHGGEVTAADLDFDNHPGVRVVFGSGAAVWAVRAASRTRWIEPGQKDNFGFAQWVHENAEALTALGPGRHYGEWFGRGIQRGYGMDIRCLALFDEQWRNALPYGLPENVGVVPRIATAAGHELSKRVAWALDHLDRDGSYVGEPGAVAEGVVVASMNSNPIRFKALADEPEWSTI
ncbi:RNA ligase family protein [Glycomyces sp. NPDC048151]|uniref:RNA ligase family protein n=1 Tax=Glycomyces sp. NPDC048151 TaxID=3364002 RepID=UPI0037192DF5